MTNRKKRLFAITTGLLIVSIGYLLSYSYRSFIYANQMNDFHLADTLGNWVAVPAASLFLWGIYFYRICNISKCIFGSIVAFLIYEFVFSLTFDWYDIIATILSGGITYLIYFCIKKWFNFSSRNNPKHN